MESVLKQLDLHKILRKYVYPTSDANSKDLTIIKAVCIQMVINIIKLSAANLQRFSIII